MTCNQVPGQPPTESDEVSVVSPELAESLEEANKQLIEDTASGVQTHSTDGTSTTMADPMRRGDELRKQADRLSPARRSPGFGVYFQKILPQGGGGDP